MNAARPASGEAFSGRGDGGLSSLLDADHEATRAAVDARYAVLDQVLEGRRPCIIYPAARMGRHAAATLGARGVKVLAFGDGSPALHGALLDGLPVLSPAQIASQHDDAAVLVASTMFDSAIAEDLRSRGCGCIVPVGYLNLRLPDVFPAREYDRCRAAVVDGDNRAAIELAYGLLDDEESRRVFRGRLAYYLSLDKGCLDGITSFGTTYFDESIYTLTGEEIVVDAGAYVGDTLKTFLTASRGRFRAYVAFEPDRESFATLSSLAASLDPLPITVVRAGLAGHTSSARLLSTAGADSRVLGESEPGGVSIPVVSLDEYFECRHAPTLVKMDIEGAEADALAGAERLLRDRRPKLALSAYHFPTDLWEIPLLVDRLMGGSRLLLRHYSREIDDTVCYALPAP